MDFAFACTFLLHDIPIWISWAYSLSNVPLTQDLCSVQNQITAWYYDMLYGIFLSLRNMYDESVVVQSSSWAGLVVQSHEVFVWFFYSTSYGFS